MNPDSSWQTIGENAFRIEVNERNIKEGQAKGKGKQQFRFCSQFHQDKAEDMDGITSKPTNQ